ncbi:MAG: hypothetical protein IPP79_21070 [Chitinophagaceae bacterium]|nr:hypothetical protein [Chitinophagaceae bacterium]
MKNLFITLSLIGLACLSVSAQFTTVPVKLWGDCMSANSNSRYRIKVEILNITTGNPAITPRGCKLQH